AIEAAIVVEATGLTRQQVRETFAGLAWAIPYRQVEKQAWRDKRLHVDLEALRLATRLEACEAWMQRTKALLVAISATTELFRPALDELEAVLEAFDALGWPEQPAGGPCREQG